MTVTISILIQLPEGVPSLIAFRNLREERIGEKVYKVKT